MPRSAAKGAATSAPHPARWSISVMEHVPNPIGIYPKAALSSPADPAKVATGRAGAGAHGLSRCSVTRHTHSGNHMAALAGALEAHGIRPRRSSMVIEAGPRSCLDAGEPGSSREGSAHGGQHSLGTAAAGGAARHAAGMDVFRCARAWRSQRAHYGTASALLCADPISWQHGPYTACTTRGSTP